jgi:3-oxo-5alpha-steroid 4-dehydrogenase
VARGHRVAGEGMSGRALIRALLRSAAVAGVDVRPRARLVGLVRDPSGRVEGVEAIVLPADRLTRIVHAVCFRLLDTAGPAFHRVPSVLALAVEGFERRRGRKVRIAGRMGVVLATGGFSFNRDLLATHAPAFEHTMPLGTAGDDGSGILQAQAVGAGVRLMDRCGASRFIAPPTAFCEGILVDGNGDRI